MSALPAPWTDGQKRALRDFIGVAGWTVIRRKCGGRSRQAVLSMVRRELGGGGITRGSYSLAEAMRETGYSRTQLERASAALNQRWLRTGRKGVFLITGDQLEDMAGWLRHDYWSKSLRIYCCLQCGTVDRPHHTFGLCRSCHGRLGRVARRYGVPWTASGLLEWLGRSGATGPRVDRVVASLRVGRAPAGRDMEYLCDLARR